MGLIACVDVPALPLQIYLREHPEHKMHPVVILDEDHPQGRVLWANEQARTHRILPGIRYASALSLSTDLRAGVIAQKRIESSLHHLCARLLRFSPDVEVAWAEPGVFWMNADGLERLFPSLEKWAQEIRNTLREDDFFSTVIVGYSRFGTYAVAKYRPGYRIFRTRHEEQVFLRKVPLERISISTRLRDNLAKLSVHTVGDLHQLPLGGMRRRFGDELHRLARLGLGDLSEPITPTRLKEAIVEKLPLDFSETNAVRLVFLCKGMLRKLLQRLAERQEALQSLSLRLYLDKGNELSHATKCEEMVSPASPTLDEKQMTDLVRLRLERVALGNGVREIELEAKGCEASLEQMRLFADVLLGGQRKARDPVAAGRALSRVKARYGDDSVVRAKLYAGHLPEAQYRWEQVPHAFFPARKTKEPASIVEGQDDRTSIEAEKASAPRTLIRRIYSVPLPLPARPRHEPDGWMLRGMEHGPVAKVYGPYLISGAWWRGLIQREYCFAETQGGELLWVFYDKRKRRWFLQGEIT